VNRPGVAGLLLATVVRLLPAGRSEWGAAMRAELAGIASHRARWRFALGCTRVVVIQPGVPRRFGYPVLMAGVLATVIGWTGRIGYPPLRWGLVVLVVVLVAVAWLGRLRGLLGPVGGSRMARWVRASGYLLVGTLALAVVASMARHDNPGEQAGNGVPVFTVLLTGYLLGFLAVTAQRSAATAGELAAGEAAGFAAAGVWALAVLAAPPIPADIASTVVLIVLAMLGAALAARRRGSVTRGLLGALCAGATAALLIVLLVGVLSTLGAPRLIPDLAPAALTPADDLAQSRIEIQDPYLAVLLVGWLIAVVQTVASLATRRRAMAGSDRVPAPMR
jgi:hypothetical protein